MWALYIVSKWVADQTISGLYWARILYNFGGGEIYFVFPKFLKSTVNFLSVSHAKRYILAYR